MTLNELLKCILMRNILRKGFFLKGKKSFTNDNTQGSNIGNPKENKITK